MTLEPGMSPLAARVVSIAASQVGVREEPPGSNAGPPLERYGLRGEGALPWCARFVRWLFDASGRQLPGNQWELGSVAFMERVFAEHGWLVQEPQPGDVVFFHGRLSSDPGRGRHVGIVSAVEGRIIQTIEGNSSDRVARQRYAFDDYRIADYGRVPDLGG